MGTGRGAGSAWRIAAVVCYAALLAGCGQAPQPAPVIFGQPNTITIEPGETLSGIALAHHVPMRELAALNRLAPPYKIFAGGQLLLPPGAATPATAPAGNTPFGIAAVAPPPAERAAPMAAPRAAATPAQSRPAPAPPAQPPPAQPPPASTAPPQTVRAAALTPSAAPPPAARPPVAPEAKPASAPAPAVPPRQPPPAELPASVETAPPAARAGMFVWPAHGRIVEGYGGGANGSHNDGINIAAPRGAPVTAAGAGVVAYAGNELRGYGNLILIKHPDNWISAYAHCEDILVKPGQKVARGQLIARVGATGNVTTPQLHFELRRGDKPVDPQRHLPPLASAAAQPPRSG